MTDLDDELVLVETEGSVAYLTLNRPDKRNAASRPLQRRLWAALDDLQESDVKVIVLTGAGETSFCSGVDLRDESPTVRATAFEPNPWLGTQRRIAAHPAIFIAAVNGFALGGGMTLVNNCELAIASETAKFGAPEITFGSYAGMAGPSVIRRLLPKHSAQLILTGQMIDAETAYRWGMVNEVVPPADLLRRAGELANLIAQYDATSLDVAKQAMRSEHLLDWDAALAHGSGRTAVKDALKRTNGSQ